MEKLYDKIISEIKENNIDLFRIHHILRKYESHLIYNEYGY